MITDAYKKHRLVYDTETFCNKYDLLEASDIVVGLSGGPDSVALLHVLKALSEKYSFNLYAVHINHCLRAEAADSDEELAGKLCDELGVPFRAVKLDVADYAKRNKISVETAGRILRYEQFDLLTDEITFHNPSSKVRIAVAHHADDLSETVLMNLFRGAGLDGLCSPLPKYRNIIRPFLFEKKKNLVAYLDDNSIPYALDLTNQDLCCTRNGWRNKVLPAVSEIAIKEPTSAITDTYSLLLDDLQFINNEVDKLFTEKVRFLGKFEALPQSIINVPKAISSRIIRRLWSDTFGNLTDFENTHIGIAVDFIRDNSGIGRVRTIDLAFGRQCYLYDGFFGFTLPKELPKVLREYKKEDGFVFTDSDIFTEIYPENTILPNLSLPFFLEKIENSCKLEYNNLSWFLPIFGEGKGKKLFLSNRLKNKVFNKAGSSCNKKLNDVMCDMHIPAIIRDDAVGIVDETDTVLWVPGIGHHEGFLSEESRGKCLNQNKDKATALIKLSFYREDRNDN